MALTFLKHLNIKVNSCGSEPDFNFNSAVVRELLKVPRRYNSGTTHTHSAAIQN